jgi:polyisoprenoid-binding protein YceI
MFAIEPNQEITWKARHNEDTTDAYISSVNVINGTIVTSYDEITNGDIEIDINTLDNNPNLPKNLIKHLKSSGYFNVLNFPNIKYSIKRHSNDSLFGNLEIIGLKKEINFPCQN